MKIQIFTPKPTDTQSPFFPIGIPAGPAAAIEQDHEWLDIDQFIREGRDHIVYCRAFGLSMKSRMEVGIDDGDLLAVVRSGFAEVGDIVIAEINGEFTIKRLAHRRENFWLVPANENYPAMKIRDTDAFQVWAVVDTVIHKCRRRAA